MSQIINIDLPVVTAIAVAATVIIVWFMPPPLVAAITLSSSWS